MVAVDPSDAKRRRARRLGAHQAAAPGDELPEAHAVLDFVGSDETLARANLALERLRRGEVAGRLVLVP